jgi:hypothetical protein
MIAKQFEPMTLGNMRANGVRNLAVQCGVYWCNHHGVLDVSSYSDDVPVPFGPRMGMQDLRSNQNAPAGFLGASKTQSMVELCIFKRGARQWIRSNGVR